MTRSSWSHAGTQDGPGLPAATAAVEDLKSSDGGDDEQLGNEEKRVRLSRRQRASGGGVANPDLLTIPGVGPRNLRKLVDNGIGDVAELKQLYKDKVLSSIFVNIFLAEPKFYCAY